jgi:hypothetical protein
LTYFGKYLGCIGKCGGVKGTKNNTGGKRALVPVGEGH